MSYVFIANIHPHCFNFNNETSNTDAGYDDKEDAEDVIILVMLRTLGVIPITITYIGSEAVPIRKGGADTPCTRRIVHHSPR